MDDRGTTSSQQVLAILLRNGKNEFLYNIQVHGQTQKWSLKMGFLMQWKFKGWK